MFYTLCFYVLLVFFRTQPEEAGFSHVAEFAAGFTGLEKGAVFAGDYPVSKPLFKSDSNGVSGPSVSTDIVVFNLTWNEKDRPVLSQSIRVTERDGYDNQPSFSADGQFLFYTAIRDGQADIFRYNFQDGSTDTLTQTPESEFSPQASGDGTGFYVVRVELRDSLQRLWRFPLDGGRPRLVMDAIEPVGYYAWLDPDYVAVFILGQGDKNTLQTGQAGKQKMSIIAADIGRCIAKVPGQPAVSFVYLKGTEGPVIRVFNPKEERVRDIAPAIPGAEDYAWSPTGQLLMASGTRLYVFDPATDQRWHFAVELRDAGIGTWSLGNISRMAISPDGLRLAVVLEQLED